MADSGFGVIETPKPGNGTLVVLRVSSCPLLTGDVSFVLGRITLPVLKKEGALRA
jgi:hypothetical protein